MIASRTISYRQDDRLKDLIDWNHIMPLPRYAGGHDEQMRGLIRGAKVIAHYNTGDYQGSVATLVELPDGRAAMYNDYYGSCSGCDAWEDASDESVRTLCINLANGAYVFENVLDAVEFMMQVDRERTAVGDYLFYSKNFSNFSWLETIFGLLKAVPAEIQLAAEQRNLDWSKTQAK